MHPTIPCRHAARAGWLAVAALALVLPAQVLGGHVTIAGAAARPGHRGEYHTIFVPLFKNRTFRRGLEMDLTRAVIRAIELRTPYKVVSNPDEADTELLGTIVAGPRNQAGVDETILRVELTWRERRTGAIVTTPGRAARPVVVQAVDHHAPETTGSTAIAAGSTAAIDRLTTQIVRHLEPAW